METSNSINTNTNETNDEDKHKNNTSSNVLKPDKEIINRYNFLNEVYAHNKEERELLASRIENNLQNFKSVDTYLDSIKIEFNDYLSKYDNLYTEISKNTLDYFNVFEEMMKDFSGELSTNSIILTDMFSKMNLLAVEMSQLEELYEKVREMRNGLEIVYKQIKK